MKNEEILKALYSEFYSVYLVDGKAGKYTVLHTTGLYEQYNKEINDFEGSVYDYTCNYVLERDRNKVINGCKLGLVIDRLKRERDFAITYQMDKTGEWRSIKFIRTENFDNDLHFLMGVLIHNNEMQQYYNTNKLKDVISSISEEFNAIYRIDLFRDKIEVLYFRFENEYYPHPDIPYSVHEREYLHNHVHPDYVQEMKKRISREAIKRHFRESNNPETVYLKGKNGKWYKMIMSKDRDYTDERPYLVLAIKECEEEMLSEMNTIVGKLIMSRMFCFSAIADLKNNSYRVLYSDNDFYKADNSGRFDQFLKIGQSMIYEEDFEYFKGIFEGELPEYNTFIENTFRAEDENGMMHFYNGVITRVILPEGERLLLFIRNEDEREIIKSRYDRLSKEHNTTKNMLYALGDLYYAMYYYNTETSSIQVLRAPEDMKEMAKQKSSYGDFFNEYVHKKVHPNDRELFMRSISWERINGEVANGRTNMYCEYMRLFGDEYRWVRLDIQVTAYSDGEVTELVFALRDMHDERTKELRYNTELRKALYDAKTANEAKSVFLSNMSHDMRTPMSAILGMTDIALSHMDDKERVFNSLNKIKISGKHLLQLINEVLDMSYIESGKIVLKEENVFLPELFHDIVIMIQDRIKSKHLNFKAEAIGVDDETVITDGVRINQIITNVLINAIKYTPEYGSINLKIEQTSRTAHNMGVYKISISDTGVGMSKEFLQKLFEPFERASDSTKSGIEGIGLGMSITLKLVNAFGGEIEVESEVGKGTTFEIYIPMKYIDSVSDNANKPDLSGYEIVYYENDEESFRDKLKDAAQKGEVAVVHSYDISEFMKDIHSLGITKLFLEPVFTSDIVGVSADATKNYRTEVMKALFAGKRVLVVDDNQINSDIICDYLEDMGIIYETAVNGKEAYEIIASDTGFDLVLMDVRMPIMNGYEATRKIRAIGTEYTDNIPIVAMTANAFEEDVMMAKNSGMNDHMSKPIVVERFWQLVYDYLVGRCR